MAAPPATAPPDTASLAPRRLGLAVFLAAAIVYLPTVGHGFAFDDDIVIVKNRHLTDPGGLAKLVTTTEWAGGGIEVRAWRPLTALTYAANHAVSGLTPWSYHAVNALLHGITAVLLLCVALRFGLAIPAATFAALLFAVHPAHVEAVANVVGRKDVLATLFLCAMLLAHGWAARAGGIRLLLPVAAYLLAMFSKEAGAVGLGLAVLWDRLAADSPWRSAGPARRRAFMLHGAYLAALVAYLGLYRAVAGGLTFGKIPFEDNPAAHASTFVRLLTAMAAVGKGLAIQLWPMGQSPDWSFASFPVVTGGSDLRLVLSALAFAAWLAIAVRLRATQPVLLFSLGWYLVALAPSANVLFPVGTLYGERLLYLPSAGLALAAGWTLQRLAGRLPPRFALASRVAAGALLALLAVATLRYSAAWADELRLFEWAVRSAPESTKVRHKLAAAYLSAGRTEEALREIDEALRILPTNARAELARSEILRRLGRTGEAESSVRRAVALSPEDADAAYALGRLERDRGRLDAAAEHWRRAVGLRSAHAAALADLSGYHMLRGESALAISFSERAVQADPGLASGWYNLGLLYRSAGDSVRSRGAFVRFVETAGTDYAAEAAAVRASLAPGGR